MTPQGPPGSNGGQGPDLPPKEAKAGFHAFVDVDESFAHHVNGQKMPSRGSLARGETCVPKQTHHVFQAFLHDPSVNHGDFSVALG